MTTKVVDLGQKLNLDELFAGNIVHNSHGQKGHFSLDSFSRIKLAANPHEYEGVTLHDFFSFGGWTAEGVGRVETGGPVVEGPQAYVFGLGVMLTAWEQPEETAYLIAEGSELTVAGTTYLVKKYGRKNFELEAMK